MRRVVLVGDVKPLYVVRLVAAVLFLADPGLLTWAAFLFAAFFNLPSGKRGQTDE